MRIVAADTKRPEGVRPGDAAEGHEYSTLIVTSALTWK